MRGEVYQHDPRHVDVLLKDIGLTRQQWTKCNPANTDRKLQDVSSSVKTVQTLDSL